MLIIICSNSRLLLNIYLTQRLTSTNLIITLILVNMVYFINALKKIKSLKKSLNGPIENAWFLRCL